MTIDSEKYKNSRYFKNIPKDKIHELATLGGHSLRTPELRKAWQDQDKIKQLYKEKTVKEIAKIYKIHWRSVYRILGGEKHD